MIFVWQINNDNSVSPISGRMDRASTTKAVNSGMDSGRVEPIVNSGTISGQVVPNIKKLVFTTSWLLFSNISDSAKPPSCALDRWEIDLKTKKVLPSLMAKAT